MYHQTTMVLAEDFFLEILIVYIWFEWHICRGQSSHYIDASQLICRANQLSGFYMMATLEINELKYFEIF